MEAHKEKVNSIVIVGGGTAGWMTAAALSHHFTNKNVSITLVESSQIGTIGVGEATIPTLRRFYRRLGLSDLDVLKATAATCKLGIEFQDWHKLDGSFIHPFGLYGQGTKEVDFHHYWMRQKQTDNASPLADFSLGVQLAKENKFTLPNTKPESQLEIFDWALHFDAALFAKLMREYSENNGTTLVDGKIVDVITCEESGVIKQVVLENNTTVEGDLFIDCSGFKGLLIDKALKVGYQDWSEWLFCDRAVAVQSESTSAPSARTVSKAHQAGWQWKIPLQHRQGNGHVYASNYIDDQSALDTLLANIDGKLLHDPRSFTFTPGRREKAWHKNCVAIGLSSGFLEPLESTSIALVETAIEKLIPSLDALNYDSDTVEQFNQKTVLEYERVRDFLILHYQSTQRTDSPFWRDCQQMKLPETLQEKVDIYKQTGEIKPYPFEIFGKDSWLAIFDGFEIYPQSYNKKADNMPIEYLNKNLAYMQQRVRQSADNALSHGVFLKKYCHFEAKISS
ncbi:tryptophan halogenase family protein [Thalassotalea sp. PP2-459]|uniref:tryptophan halogenase family protein n=1 Tax=Thalassotalea sp. PP2-459 TaxID=1742724 RepID=UPI000945139D|nr:tryptophan halogenase family protein [Thalassotalea sp. PP2-459]OKY26078.1 tryptophan halogenase [Thalassotalea sp. PP2-459]